jgi:hypothetical protein
VPLPTDPKILLEIYKLQVEEYRFQVRLNWDRTKYFLALNAGLLSVGISLVKVTEDSKIRVLVALLFLVGIVTSVLGIRAIRKGREYFRRTRNRMILVAQLLGLNDDLTAEGHPGWSIAIGPTQGMNDIQKALERPDPGPTPLQPGTVVYGEVMLLKVGILLNLVGVIFATWPIVEWSYDVARTLLCSSHGCW